MISLEWLPPPADFRRELQAATGASAAAERLERLAALAQTRLSFIENIQLDNALRATDRLADAAGQPAAAMTRVRLALLSSSTVDHLLPPLRVAALRRRVRLDVRAGAFGQYRQELLAPPPELTAFAPQIVLLSLMASEFIAGARPGQSAGDTQSMISGAVMELRGLWSKARQTFNAAVIQQSFLDVTEPLFGQFDRLVQGTSARLIAQLNAEMADAAAADGVLLLDVNRASARDGLDAWFDVARWLQGKIEIAPQAAAAYGDLAARLVAAQLGRSRKCAVLDLDNTVWGGVVGDVGVEGLVLGEGSAVGEAHLALQRYARSLSERGVLLAICSKNDPKIAADAFERHPEMLLKRTDIAAFVANWTDKAENLRQIAAQLNIGLDSLVFIDDNPAERARVRESLPMVAVPELPEDPAGYVRCIANAGYFEAAGFTDEDRKRTGEYAANNERETLRESAQSMEDFLRGLAMTVSFGPVDSVNLPRVTQLINKTNQFNTTTRRYTSQEVQSLAAAPEYLTLQFRLADRFGDNGLVSVMLICQASDDPSVLDIVNWVMSCRVFGRQLEVEAMNIAVEAARSRGARTLRAELIATPKNGVISHLYETLGFTPVAAPAPAGVTRWVADLAAYVHRPTFIRREAQT